MSLPTITSDGDEPAPVERVRRLVIVVSPDPAAPREVRLVRDLELGREVADGLALADGELSRVHARVLVGARIEILDRDSRNGVFVDGRRVERATLAAGAVVRVGQTLMVLADDELVAGVPLVPELPRLRGGSLAMQRVRGELTLAAPRSVPVLILGETGVGKERVAEELHRQSGRAGPWVAVNCAAIPAGLAESELFGRVAGAFTGATRSDGLFVAADGGTIFLDEVGELAPAVQAKLLRVLSGGELRPVGGTAARTVDVRVVAATHRPIDDAAEFRADTLARLAGWIIRIPPLRARREDVLELARDLAGGVLELASAEALLLYGWPGNVRELEQTLQRARILAGDGPIALGHLPEAVRAVLPPRPRRAADPLADLRGLDRSRPPSADELRQLLARLEGNVAAVARFYGKDRRQVYRWMARHGIEPSADGGADRGGGGGDDDEDAHEPDR